jgi:hypothetical protein
VEIFGKKCKFRLSEERLKEEAKLVDERFR